VFVRIYTQFMVDICHYTCYKEKPSQHPGDMCCATLLSDFKVAADILVALQVGELPALIRFPSTSVSDPIFSQGKRN